ncbi:hypothetical protein NEOKW01_0888 [Nematocida sp. AWRm80]|nr:hypothetical protein NEOKW01_0888 [Nematocida sp. AWRm80]
MKSKREDKIIDSLVELINHLKNISEGLYKHTYDIDTSLIQINQPVISALEKVIECNMDDLYVSQEFIKYIQDNDPDLNSVNEYIKLQEERRKDLLDQAKGKSKYFKMFSKGIQQTLEEPKGTI